MSGYKNTKCIRLEVLNDDWADLAKAIGKEEILKDLVREYGNDCLWEFNERIEGEGIRIIYYKERLYIDLILENDWADGRDMDLCMSLSEIQNKVENFKHNHPNVGVKKILILAYTWYNGCDEPYTC